MEKQNNGLQNDLQGFFIIVIIIAAFLYSIRKDIKDFWASIISTFKAITNFIASQLFFIILAIIVLAILIYFIAKLVKTIKRKKEEKKTEKEELENFLKEDVKHNTESIEKYDTLINEKIKICEDKRRLKKYVKRLKKKHKKVGQVKEEVEHKEHINQLIEKEREIDKRIEEKERKEMEAEKDKEKILDMLEIWKNNVFKKFDLNEIQIKTLKEKGFEQVNQFDILEKRFISVLIKPYEKLNHSREHIFLVWSVKRFLEKMGIEVIEEHLTKGADITFKHNQKWFAIEIETGKLLKAPKQLKEKVNYLNKQYPNRWLFVVSNEKLVPRYAEFGLSTQRNRVQENIEKLLKNA